MRTSNFLLILGFMWAGFAITGAFVASTFMVLSSIILGTLCAIGALIMALAESKER